MTAERRQRRSAATVAAARAFLNGCDAGGGLIGPVTRRAARLFAALRAADHARAARVFAVSDDSAPRPAGADWAWRPDPWQGGRTPPQRPESGTPIAPGVKLFHDGGGAVAVALPSADQAPHALGLDPKDFAGSYVSLAIDLPADALGHLSPAHILGLGAVLVHRGSAPVIFARLTLLCGPNRMEATIRPSLPDGGGALLAEFDMFSMGLHDRRADSGWVDLVLSHPGTAAITIRDLALYRRYRSAV